MTEATKAAQRCPQGLGNAGEGQPRGPNEPCGTPSETKENGVSEIDEQGNRAIAKLHGAGLAKNP